ncbi:hypothetical protein TSOC_000241, partial [Tetrabaena socialis]
VNGRASSATSSRDHCFALETMDEDGQGWVRQELGDALIGLAHRTPRATARTTQLLRYRGDLADSGKAMRRDCSRAPGGVTLCNKENQDCVGLSVEVDPGCLRELAAQQAADVVYAVESLDTAIMDSLNNFLWWRG